MPDAIPIRDLPPAEAETRLDELAAILVDAVAGGASVNFLAGFDAASGRAFWQGQLPEMRAGSRRLFVAERDGRLLGTVVLTYAPQPNGPYRAEIGKMIVHSSARRQGIGDRLLAAAEEAALAAEKTLLILDTETGSAGDALYRRRGWTPAGTIPGYAYNPAGVPVPATFFYKEIGR